MAGRPMLINKFIAVLTLLLFLASFGTAFAAASGTDLKANSLVDPPVSSSPKAGSGTSISDAPVSGAGSGTLASESPVISAPSAILTDTDRGQVLYSKDPDKKLHISAACKLMTVLIAVEKGDLSSNVTISTDSVDAEGSALNLEVGKKYTLEDLLYGIMLTSANNAAIAVSENIAGDTGKFVAMMNDEAAKLKMNDTHFTNPTGLLDENQYTTARDISLLIKYALTRPEFNNIFSVKARPWFYGEDGSKILTSQNKLFWSYDGVDGGKTGYNSKDQQSVIATAQRENMRLICVILDAPEKNLFTDAAAVFDYGFDNYRKGTLVSKGDILKTAQLNGTEINLVSQSEVSYVHPIGDSYIKGFTAASFLEPPIKLGKAAGTATYTLGDGSTITIDLFPQKEIVTPDDFLTSARKKITENRNILYLVVFLLLIEVIIIAARLVKLMKKLIGKLIRKKA